jgi:hypothetical protein
MILHGSLLISMGGGGMILVRDVMPTTASRSLDSATRFVGRSIGLFDSDSSLANAHGSRRNHDEDEWPPIDMAGLDGCFGTAIAAPARVSLSVSRNGMFVEINPNPGFNRRPDR